MEKFGFISQKSTGGKPILLSQARNRLGASLVEEHLPVKTEKLLWANPLSQIDVPSLPSPIFYFHSRTYVAMIPGVGSNLFLEYCGKIKGAQHRRRLKCNVSDKSNVL